MIAYVCVRKSTEDVCVFLGCMFVAFLQECVNTVLFIDHFVPKTSRTLRSLPRHALGVDAGKI